MAYCLNNVYTYIHTYIHIYIHTYIYMVLMVYSIKCFKHKEQHDEQDI